MGELLDQLEADGLADNTIIFHWADHGEGLPRYKRWPYDGGIHVPLIVRWPGQIEPGSVSDQLVSTIDLAPTVLSLCGAPRPMHLQGQPFLGPDAEPREYVFATRDRFDESYDMVRAVRDKRFKYLRNYLPTRPPLSWLPFRDRHAGSQALWDGYAAGTLDESQRVLFPEPRPAEELYDTETDPHELHNLADDPAHRQTLQRMRRQLDQWRAEIGDMGEMDETVMKRQWWGGDEQPTTAPVRFFVYGGGRYGQEPVGGYDVVRGPAVVHLHCPTQGASIAWRDAATEDGPWNLYTQPIRIEPGREMAVCAHAHRIGYRPSEQTTVRFF